MSEQNQQDKTFDPTPQRLRKAREEGNVFKSQEIQSVGMLMVGMTTLGLMSMDIYRLLESITSEVFLEASTRPLNHTSASALVSDLSTQLLEVMAPYFGAMLVAGVALNVGQTGWLLTSKPLMPKANRISPLQGLKRIFSSKGLFGVAKAVIKVGVVGPIAYWNIESHLPDLLTLHVLSVPDILGLANQWILGLTIQIVGVLLILSGFDFSFEKWKHKKDLMMSKQEIKDEAKQNEGSPEVKQKRREIAFKLANRPRLDHAVLQADVVVTNPTHYAVALHYDPLTTAAPRVLVKGIRKRALRIKTLAKENNIPTIENRPLARALYASVEEQQEIPEELYKAVAAVLAEVYKQRGRA